MRHTTSGRIGSTLFALTLGALGCSGAASEAPAANPEMGANTVEPPPDTPAAEPNTQDAAPAPAPAVETAATADEPAGGDASGESGPNAPREVKYVITPEGLKVELEGTRFLIKAEPKKIAAGLPLRFELANGLPSVPVRVNGPPMVPSDVDSACGGSD